MNKILDKLVMKMCEEDIALITIHQRNDMNYPPATLTAMEKAGFLYAVTYDYNTKRKKTVYYFEDGKERDFSGFRKKVYGV